MQDTRVNDAVAYEQGYDAYWEGVDSDDNPHVRGTEQYASWDEGWVEAQVDDDEEGEGW